MPRHLPRPHERLEVLEPCSADWDSMAGDERARFCSHCRKHVHNLSELTPREALDLVLRTGGQLCMSIERDPQGVPRTRALAVPLYRIGRRASRLAAGAFGAVVTLGSTAGAGAQTSVPAPARPAATSPANPSAAGVRPELVDVQHTQLTPQPIEELKASPTRLQGLILARPSEPLVRAAWSDDLEGVKRILLSGGADVNVVDKSFGTSALAHAFMNGNREMLRELLWRGARVNERLAYKQTALMRLGPGTTVEIVRDLLDAGADVNLSDEDGNTALIFAAEHAHPHVVKLLLSAGARIDAQNKEGQTALMNAAATSGNVEIVQVLLAAGADTTRRDAEGHTALWRARHNGSDKAAALLLIYGAHDEPEEEEKP